MGKCEASPDIDSLNWDTDTVLYKKVYSSVNCCFKSVHVLVKKVLWKKNMGNLKRHIRKHNQGVLCSEALS